MKLDIHFFYRRLIAIVVTAIVAVTVAVRVEALPLTSFAESSRLAEGRWVKVGVTTTGMHLITNSQLQSLGFSNPERVGVFGYGGERLSDLLSVDKYVDDLPRVASVVTSRGIVFYASGPEGWRSAPGNAAREGWMEHVINPYTETCYYYLTETDGPATVATDGIPGVDGATNVATTFTERLYHELDQISIFETGHNLYGEDFFLTPTRSFNFPLTDRVEGTDVWMQTRFFANSPNAGTSVSYTANGKKLPVSTTDNIPRATGTYCYGDTCLSQKTFQINSNKLDLSITHNPASGLKSAYLDRIDINYTRPISLPATGSLIFTTSTPAVRLGGVSSVAGLHVWDVTNPLNILEMNVKADGGQSVSWTGEYTGRRTYIAWTETASMNSVTSTTAVANQNIHAAETPEMVIITVPGLVTYANAIADLHRTDRDSLKVLVVTDAEAYNEFSSGMPDPGAFRRLLKMFYDRGRANPAGPQLQYCMLIGRPTYDHRRKTAALNGVTAETMPVWQTDISINDNYSYSSDDILAMLDDNTGLNQSIAYLRIAVGRLPVSDAASARIYVDKLTRYMKNPPSGQWLNQMLVIADDQDNGTHLDQAETFERNLTAFGGEDRFLVNKVYLDAYNKINNRVPDARSNMDRKLNEGVVWWQYIGHASHNSWTHENLVTSAEVSEFYLSRVPVLFAATCDFGRWDSEETSGAESMLLTDGGGTVAACTATRPVYIVQNGNLTGNLSRAIAERDDRGRLYRFGEIIRRAKNGYSASNTPSQIMPDSNRLRYVIFGDPALPLSTPDNHVIVESINGVDVENPDPAMEPATIQAHQNAVVTGRIVDAAGNHLSDFNGTISLVIYDAEQTTTTLGRGTDDNPGKVANYEQHGDMLYSGRAVVEGGRFTLTAPMPSDVVQNYRPATMSVIAEETGGRRATGINRNFYVYGYDTAAHVDSIAPTIDYIYLNHSTFENGGTVDSAPLLIASVSDNIGINLSTAGIGHQMSLRIDNNISLTDVAQYFTPAEDGSPSGTIAYPISALQDGAHTLMLRVWDTSNNPTETSLDFFVDAGAMPKIFDVYTDTNPASTEARFYIEHNRPDARLTVTVEVFNLNGRLEWSSTVTGRSDMFRTAPVVWDLTDRSGRRVPRGIYLYRASLSADGGATSTSMSKRIAVTAR